MTDRQRGQTREATQSARWTNPSVVKLLREDGAVDPVEAITRRARSMVIAGLDGGWSGPPFDPLRLADLLKIDVVPCADIADAQTVPIGSKGRIEFNPNRPSGRVRYSVAHEIAHTLFTDCFLSVRQRIRHHDALGDEWQLEALCNIGAAEILMPFGSMANLSEEDLGIERLVALQKQFQVSTEALLIRVVRLIDQACAMFCASRIESGPGLGRYRVDYSIASASWSASLPALLPSATPIADCVAIGYTTIFEEKWEDRIGKLHIEGVGIPPYPGARFPRVVGIVRPLLHGEVDAVPALVFVRGSALKPRGDGPKLVVHVVNDKTANWGGRGFAQGLRSEWPAVQEDFQAWASSHPSAFRLGAVRVCDAGPNLRVASVVAQKGYGESVRPRIRYGALREGLTEVARTAAADGATLHMPRIGAGHAGASWPVVEDLIRVACSENRISATIYDLPGGDPPPQAPQREFKF